MNRPIGIFDSGIGGLTVVREVIKNLPNEDIVYFGDTARVPYGTKSPNTVIKFSVENTLFLLRFKVKVIVVACNTSSSYAIETLKNNFKLPVIGVIGPGIEEAAKTTKCGRIGVIGTTATIHSASYQKQIKAIDPRLKVFNQACPLFVSLVEEGWLNDKVTYMIAERYLKPLKDKKIDTLILGCTHYPLLKKVIQEIMGRNVTLVDSAKQVACHVKKILSWGDSISSNKKKPKYKYYVSDEPDKFIETGEKFLGRKIEFARKMDGYV